MTHRIYSISLPMEDTILTRPESVLPPEQSKGPSSSPKLKGLDVQQRAIIRYSHTGGLAQMVERSLSMREALGSIPRSSSIDYTVFVLLGICTANTPLKKQHGSVLQTGVISILDISRKSITRTKA
ncbi:hypothetical protein K493DRAFT_374199 [Basidiobolus meristosporus CBS 931.73]|uniref:Uncharacterized protein n=1 Tax=Basidiobolus meristosporus CBS 931.73 TaxID=1314790 RepID=A0A1Y1Y827_9FUNG|nr:hypothetical protein K493DRAFT_374199 [Basidiobolus meristosporus CBS 931.73]|eukprot:ORX94167.1 hypothetical protein K493DRAFT_374199 [Basidiobolus meristosporus CBS 931.73]